MLKRLLLFFRYSFYQQARKVCGSFFFCLSSLGAYGSPEKSLSIVRLLTPNYAEGEARWLLLPQAKPYGRAGFD